MKTHCSTSGLRVAALALALAVVASAQTGTYQLTPRATAIGVGSDKSSLSLDPAAEQSYASTNRVTIHVKGSGGPARSGDFWLEPPPTVTAPDQYHIGPVVFHVRHTLTSFPKVLVSASVVDFGGFDKSCTYPATWSSDDYPCPAPGGLTHLGPLQITFGLDVTQESGAFVHYYVTFTFDVVPASTQGIFIGGADCGGSPGIGTSLKTTGGGRDQAAPACFADNIQAVQVTYNPQVDPRSQANYLIAGKATAIRVFLGTKGGTDVSSGIKGIIFAEGVAKGVEASNEANVVARVNAPNQDNVDDSLNFNLPLEWTAAGARTFQIQLSLNGNPQPGKTLTIYFRSPQWPDVFSIGYFLVCSPNECPIEPKAPQSFVEQVFPVKSGGVVYQQVLPNQQWKNSLYDPATGSLNNKEALKLLKVLVATHLLFDQFISLDQLVAWVPQTLAGPGLESIPGIQKDDGGFGHVWWATLPSTGDPADPKYGRLLAHSLAHNLGLKEQTYNEVGEGSFDVLNRRIYGRGEDSLTERPYGIWPSRNEYERLRIANAIAPGPGNQHVPSAKKVARQESAAAPGQFTEYLILGGNVSPDGSVAQFDPGFRVVSPQPGAASNPDGTLCLRFDGNSANDYCFNPIFLDPDNPASDGGFVVKAPVPGAVSNVTLVQRDPVAGETQLTSLSTASGPPTLTITSPTPGDTWQGTHPLTWMASDPDGNALSYIVQYSADNGATWIPLTFPLTDTQYDVDPSQLNGSTMLFRVLASNGLLTASAVVGPVTLVQRLTFRTAATSIDFGTPDVGIPSVVRSIDITNTGTGPLILTAQISGDPAFQLTNKPVPLWPKSTQPLSVSFNATAATSAKATLTLTSPDKTPAPVTISLTAGGATNGGGGTPSISASSLDFLSVNTTDPARELTLNIGNRYGRPPSEQYRDQPQRAGHEHDLHALDAVSRSNYPRGQFAPAEGAFCSSVGRKLRRDAGHLEQ